MSLRKFAVLVDNLPADSALRRARGEHPEWDLGLQLQSLLVEILADLEAETRAAYLKKGSPRPRVLTVRRPWDEDQPKADRQTYRQALLGV